MEFHEEILRFLDGLGVRYELIEHPPVHTMEECEGPMKALHGLMPKNLFLRPRRQAEFWLCIVRPDAAFSTSSVSRQVGSSRLQFASAEEMNEILLTQPGAVSPLALIREEARDVRFLADERLRDEERLIFHPCVHTRSLAVSGKDFFEVFLPATGHQVTWVTPDA